VDIINNLTDILQYSDPAEFAGQRFPLYLHRDLFLKTYFFIRDVKLIHRSIKPKIPKNDKGL
jgi:hypothetical protein